MRNNIIKQFLKKRKYLNNFTDNEIFFASILHAVYEKFSDESKWKTQKSTRHKKFTDIPKSNQVVMCKMSRYIFSVCGELK